MGALSLLRLATVVAAAAGGLNAAAQTAGPADTITVTGGPFAGGVRQHAVDFVRATGVTAGEVPAARWTDPVCPHVIGITDAAAHLVEAKLRAVAADAGIAAAPAGCTANIAVVFATDGGAVVRDIVARQPRRFAGVSPAAVAALTAGRAPIRWWYTSEVRDRDGSPASATSPPPGIFGGAEGGGLALPATGRDDLRPA